LRYAPPPSAALLAYCSKNWHLLYSYAKIGICRVCLDALHCVTPICWQPSNQPERTQSAHRRHIPLYHRCVLCVLCGYDNKSVCYMIRNAVHKRCILPEITGYGLRVTGYRLRVTGYRLRVTGWHAGDGYVMMPGLTRSVPNQVFIWMNAPIRLRRGGRFHSFSQKNSPCEFFCEKR
jgi:hypothetical protein